MLESCEKIDVARTYGVHIHGNAATEVNTVSGSCLELALRVPRAGLPVGSFSLGSAELRTGEGYRLLLRGTCQRACVALRIVPACAFVCARCIMHGHWVSRHCGQLSGSSAPRGGSLR